MIVPVLVSVPLVMLRYEAQLACDAILMVPELVVKVSTVRALYDVKAVAKSMVPALFVIVPMVVPAVSTVAAEKFRVPPAALFKVKDALVVSPVRLMVPVVLLIVPVMAPVLLVSVPVLVNVPLRARLPALRLIAFALV